METVSQYNNTTYNVASFMRKRDNLTVFFQQLACMLYLDCVVEDGAYFYFTLYIMKNDRLER